jgi:hypothetical protein
MRIRLQTPPEAKARYPRRHVVDEAQADPRIELEVVAQVAALCVGRSVTMGPVDWAEAMLASSHSTNVTEAMRAPPFELDVGLFVHDKGSIAAMKLS